MPPTSSSPASPGRQSWLTTLGWGAYLACSWTWCIGMFLPVLLVRDFGIWGFVVFAVPNVVGAGAMGWVLRESGQARNVTVAHAPAIRAFSEVTWLFQLFFLVWLLVSNPGLGWLPVAALVGVVLVPIVIVRSLRASHTMRVLSIILWVLSAGFMAWGLIHGDLGAPPDERASLGSLQLVWLAPVCGFGFLLCPYLDATFLLARQQQERTFARASFSFGFVVMFSVMIVFTLLYARLFSRVGKPVQFVDPKTAMAWLVFIHMGAQIAFTNMAHGSARREISGRTERGGVRGVVAGLLIVGLLTFLKQPGDWRYGGLTPGEIVYRLFMSFYGLVFPAYVWLCMIPVRGEPGTQKPTRVKLVVLVVAVALAAPCYWMGFIERQTWWLGPGLGIVLAARVFLPRGAERPNRGAAVGGFENEPGTK